MKKTRLNIEKAKQKSKVGLKDRGRICFQCKSCQKDLMEFWITLNNQDLHDRGIQPLRANILVECICGGNSEIMNIEGQFVTGIAKGRKGFEPVEDKEINGVDLIFRAW